MSEEGRYEILVIGSGESGKWLTCTMAQADRRTANSTARVWPLCSNPHKKESR